MSLVNIDIGRPINHFVMRLVVLDLTKLAKQAHKDMIIQQKEVQTADGRTFLLGVRLYRTMDNVINGVVFTLEDITQRKQIEHELKESRAALAVAVQATNDAVWDYILMDNSVWWSAGYNKLFWKLPSNKKGHWQLNTAIRYC